MARASETNEKSSKARGRAGAPPNGRGPSARDLDPLDAEPIGRTGASARPARGNGNGNGSGKSNGKSNGNGARHASSRPPAARAKPRRLPIVDDDDGRLVEPRRSVHPRRPPSNGALGMQLQIATFLRTLDRMVSGLVSAYDSVFVVDSKDKADLFLEAGLRFAAEGRINEAIDAHRKVAQLLPDDPLPLVELGALQLRRQAPTAAIQVLERAKELGGCEPRMHSLLADAYLAEDRVEEAVAELEIAFAADVHDSTLAYRLGMALDRQGNHAEAVEAFALAVELEPLDVRYHQSLGFALESVGNREEAVRCFKRALELEHNEDMNAAEA